MQRAYRSVGMALMSETPLNQRGVKASPSFGDSHPIVCAGVLPAVESCRDCVLAG